MPGGTPQGSYWALNNIYGKSVGEFLLNILMLDIKNQHRNITDELHYMYWYEETP